MRQLLLVGAGGFGREAAQAVLAANRAQPRWDLLGFLDDMAELRGRELDGIPVVGPITAFEAHPGALLAICTGRPDNYFSRKRLVRRLGLPPTRYATLVHPQAAVPPAAEVGPGTIILATCVLTAAVRIGAHVAMMPAVVVTHDDVIGDFATLGTGVHLGGGVSIGEGAYLGAGALIREGVAVGPWALVGMGSVVLADVPAGEVWAGVPARRLRTLDVPEEVRSAL